MSFTLGLLCPHDDKGNCTCRTYVGRLSFWTASEYGFLEQVRTILEKSPERLNTCDSFGYTALHYAAQRDKVEVTAYLIKKGADVNARNCGATPLHRAAAFNAASCCKLLISSGANVNEKDTSFGDGRTALMKAVAAGFADIVQILLSSGKADQGLTDSQGLTAWEICPSDRIDIKALLIEQHSISQAIDPSEKLIPKTQQEIPEKTEPVQRGLNHPGGVLTCGACGLPSLFMQRNEPDGSLICKNCRN